MTLLTKLSAGFTASGKIRPSPKTKTKRMEFSRHKFAFSRLNFAPLDFIFGTGIGVWSLSRTSVAPHDATSTQEGVSSHLQEPSPTSGTHDGARQRQSVASRDHGVVKEIARIGRCDAVSDATELQQGGAR